VLETQKDGPFTPDAVNRLIKRIGERAGFDFLVHAHMLRHGCGYALANAGHDTRAIQDWLGHRSIQHTVRYTELAPTRFKDFWRVRGPPLPLAAHRDSAQKKGARSSQTRSTVSCRSVSPVLHPLRSCQMESPTAWAGLMDIDTGLVEAGCGPETK
jgi:hypothetical protein